MTLKNRIESCMALRGDTQSSLAECLGISRSRLNAKINSKHGADFNRAEMVKMQERYQLSAEEAGVIFLQNRCLEQDTRCRKVVQSLCTHTTIASNNASATTNWLTMSSQRTTRRLASAWC